LPRTDTWFLTIGADVSSRRYIAKRQRRRPARPCRPTAEGMKPRWSSDSIAVCSCRWSAECLLGRSV